MSCAGTLERMTHQQNLRCLPLLRVLQQTCIYKLLRFLRKSSLRPQPRCWLLHDLVHQFNDAHRCGASVQAHALASPLAPPSCRFFPGQDGVSMGGSPSEKLISVAGTLDIGEVRVVGVREREAPESELNEGDA